MGGYRPFPSTLNVGILPWITLTCVVEKPGARITFDVYLRVPCLLLLTQTGNVLGLFLLSSVEAGETGLLCRQGRVSDGEVD